MATPRFARLTGATTLAADTRLLDLELLGDDPLGFAGGQYLIVDSGLTLPSGKAAKRAYSILTGDGDQRRVQLASMRIPGGLGSGYMHEVALGSELKFSGPWGKMKPAEGLGGRTLVLATDTGVTAALGLLAGRAFAPLLAETTFIWLRTAPDYFLPDGLVRERLPPGLGRGELGILPAIDHPERVAWVRGLLRELLAAAPAQAFITGDGAVNYALLDDLVAAGVPASKDSVESFFNMPRKAA